MAITWKNVNAPNSAGILESMRRSSAGIGTGLNQFGEAIQSGVDDVSQIRTSDAIANLQGLTDPSERDAAIQAARGSFINTDELIQANTALGDRERDITRANQATTLFDRKIEDGDYLKGRRAFDESAALQAKQIALAESEFGILDKRSDNFRADRGLKLREKTATNQQTLFERGTATFNANAPVVAAQHKNTLAAAVTQTTDRKFNTEYSKVLDQMNDPNNGPGYNTQFISMLNQMERTGNVSAANRKRKEATIGKFDDQVTKLERGSNIAQSILGNLTVADAPANIKAQTLSTLTDKYIEQLGVTTDHATRIAKKVVSQDDALSVFFANVGKRTSLQTELDKTIRTGAIDVSKQEVSMLTDLQTTGTMPIKDKLAAKHSKGKYQMDPTELSLVVEGTFERVNDVLKTSTLTDRTKNLIAIKLLNSSNVEWEFFNLGSGGRNVLAYDSVDQNININELPIGKFLTAVNSMLHKNKKLSNLQLKAIQATYK